MKNINLAISGCMGRMGQQLIQSSKKNKNFKLVALTENRPVNKKFNGIKPELNSDKAFKKTDIIIDFTVPNCTLEILKIASKLRKK
jgi:4-hydroxy-tetrahydrodipicolinate reductase